MASGSHLEDALALAGRQEISILRLV